jgi:hypothetical protein
MVSVKEVIRVLAYTKQEDIKKLFSLHYPTCYNKLYGCPEDRRHLPLKEVVCPDCAWRLTAHVKQFFGDSLNPLEG